MTVISVITFCDRDVNVEMRGNTDDTIADADRVDKIDHKQTLWVIDIYTILFFCCGEKRRVN